MNSDNTTLRSGRYIPVVSGNTEERLNDIEQYLMALSEELEVIVNGARDSMQVTYNTIYGQEGTEE